jgi:hypothetical protein
MSGPEQGLADRDAAKQARDKQLAARRKEDQAHQPPSAGTVDGILGSMNATGGSAKPGHAVDENSHREGQIQGIGRIQDAVFTALNLGMDAAKDLIMPAEMPKNVDGGWLAQILGIAAMSTLYGSSAALGAWVAGALTSSKPSTSEKGPDESAPAAAPKGRSPAATFIAYAMKDLVRKALSPSSPVAPPDVRDLKLAYFNQLRAEELAAVARFSAEWPKLHDQLAGLTSAELDAALIASQSLLASTAEILDAIKDRIVIGWTNFLAQASHGAMGGWDFFEKNGSKGAVGLKDSAQAPERPGQDPTRSNVDPTKTQGALENNQVHAIDAESGMLEIFIDMGGQLLADPDHRMRLGNVGPEVRKRLAQLGRVGDLPINKIIRICSEHTNPATQYASVMITADGYVRDINWTNLQQMIIHHRTPVGPARIKEDHDAMNDMINGKSSVDVHRATDAETTHIKLMAERAQNLSLRALEA